MCRQWNRITTFSSLPPHLNIDNKPPGYFTEVGVVIKNDSDGIQLLDYGYLLVHEDNPQINKSAIKIDEPVIVDGKIIGKFLSNKDEDGFFKMYYDGPALPSDKYCEHCGREW